MTENSKATEGRSLYLVLVRETSQYEPPLLGNERAMALVVEPIADSPHWLYVTASRKAARETAEALVSAGANPADLRIFKADEKSLTAKEPQIRLSLG